MKLLFHITLAKIKKNAKTNLFQATAVLVSMLVISFFLCLVFSLKTFIASEPSFGIEAVNGESLLTVESIKNFFEEILSGIVKIAGAVAVLSFVSLFIFTKMRTEKNRQFFATMTSIGATSRQQKLISATETLLLYGIPVFLGSFLGFLPSRFFAAAIARIFIADYSARDLSLLVPLFLAILGTALVLLFACLPYAENRSVIESVKAHNRKEAERIHSYRQSYTFRHMPIEKRIAKKGVAYYGGAYRRISFMLCSCALYPLLALFFFILVSETSVSDYTPGYGINVGALATVFAEKIALFGLLAFLALSVFGIFEAAYVIGVHNRIRRETMQAYKSIGMTESSIKRVLKYEYRTAVFHAAIGLLFILALLVLFINGV